MATLLLFPTSDTSTPKQSMEEVLALITNAKTKKVGSISKKDLKHCEALQDAFNNILSTLKSYEELATKDLPNYKLEDDYSIDADGEYTHYRDYDYSNMYRHSILPGDILNDVVERREKVTRIFYRLILNYFEETYKLTDLKVPDESVSHITSYNDVLNDIYSVLGHSNLAEIETENLKDVLRKLPDDETGVKIDGKRLHIQNLGLQFIYSQYSFKYRLSDKGAQLLKALAMWEYGDTNKEISISAATHDYYLDKDKVYEFIGSARLAGIKLYSKGKATLYFHTKDELMEFYTYFSLNQI